MIKSDLVSGGGTPPIKTSTRLLKIFCAVHGFSIMLMRWHSYQWYDNDGLKNVIVYARDKLKTIFYKVNVEKSNKTQICRILPYFFQMLGWAEFCIFAFYLIFHINLKKNGVYYRDKNNTTWFKISGGRRKGRWFFIFYCYKCLYNSNRCYDKLSFSTDVWYFHVYKIHFFAWEGLSDNETNLLHKSQVFLKTRYSTEVVYFL